MSRVRLMESNDGRAMVRERMNGRKHYAIVRPCHVIESIPIMAHVRAGLAKGSELVAVPAFPNPLFVTLFVFLPKSGITARELAETLFKDDPDRAEEELIERDLLIALEDQSMLENLAKALDKFFGWN